MDFYFKTEFVTTIVKQILFNLDIVCIGHGLDHVDEYYIQSSEEEENVSALTDIFNDFKVKQNEARSTRARTSSGVYVPCIYTHAR